MWNEVPHAAFGGATKNEKWVEPSYLIEAGYQIQPDEEGRKFLVPRARNEV